MPEPDFYAIFGVSPSATQEEIRAAHRELVKRYHPDIYSTSGDKARATEKLREINAAYAVLGNVERRKAYDASRVESPRRPAQAAPARPRAAAARPRATPRPQQRPLRRAPVRIKFRWNKKIFTRSRLAGAGAGVMLFLLAIYLLNRPPEVTPMWFLLQKTEIEPETSGTPSSSKGWETLGTFGVRAECARVLKTHVKADQEQGSQAIFDESNGTVAITVLLTETDVVAGAKNLATGQKKVTQRVRQYECRSVEVRQTDSWLRLKLRRIGLVR